MSWPRPTTAGDASAPQRLRKRYKAILRERITATREDPDGATIDDEIRHLFTAIAR